MGFMNQKVRNKVTKETGVAIRSRQAVIYTVERADGSKIEYLETEIEPAPQKFKVGDFIEGNYALGVVTKIEDDAITIIWFKHNNGKICLFSENCYQINSLNNLPNLGTEVTKCQIAKALQMS
jgi:hypothetical protein